nr:hypothetical protein [Tanacetum cinerariifolium]
MARQCTQPKRPRNVAWFKEKLMLVEAQEAGKVLNEEQLAFLVDPGIEEASVAQQTIPHNAFLQAKDLDAYDSDCDDLSSAKAILMANLSSYNLDVLSEVPYFDSYPNDMLNQDVQQMTKNVVDTAMSKHAATIAPRIFKLNFEPLAPKLLQNKDVHMDYIKHSKDNANILWEIVKNARALSPLDSNLDSTYKYVQRIQEVLVYVRETCPCFSNLSEKLMVVTPMNKDKKVRFANPLTSSSNTQKTQDSNKPLLHSTRVICSTSASGSKPSSNTKNDRISQASSSNKTNKVEDQSRSVKSRKNKKNRVDKSECNTDVMQSVLNANSISEPISNAFVKHSLSNAKFKSLCAICNKCLFDANHVMCLIEHVNDVNVRNKAKS